MPNELGSVPSISIQNRLHVGICFADIVQPAGSLEARKKGTHFCRDTKKPEPLATKSRWRLVSAK